MAPFSTTHMSGRLVYRTEIDRPVKEVRRDLQTYSKSLNEASIKAAQAIDVKHDIDYSVSKSGSGTTMFKGSQTMINSNIIDTGGLITVLAEIFDVAVTGEKPDRLSGEGVTFDDTKGGVGSEGGDIIDTRTGEVLDDHMIFFPTPIGDIAGIERPLEKATMGLGISPFINEDTVDIEPAEFAKQLQSSLSRDKYPDMEIESLEVKAGGRESGVPITVLDLGVPELEGEELGGMSDIFEEMMDSKEMERSPLILAGIEDSRFF